MDFINDDIWKPIHTLSGFECCIEYYVNDAGQVKSTKGVIERILKQRVNKNGYAQVNLTQRIGRKQTITTTPGAVIFDSALSFSMIRGQHVQLTVLGAMEVSENGDIANWKIPGKMVKGMGGAMDLVASAENIIVAMTHTNRKGMSKLLKKCTLPITGINCVKKIVTDLAVINITKKGFELLERAPGVTIEEIINSTDAKLIINGEIAEMDL